MIPPPVGTISASGAGARCALRVCTEIDNAILSELLDAALISDPEVGGGKLALTIDGYVVTPWKFAGGDIGRLAVSGTVNDLAVSGAEVVGLALSFILAEGFPLAALDEIMTSIGNAAREANVKILTGDTKVVGHNQADGVYITTAGVGRVPANREISPKRVKPGQKLIVNGPVGEHGLTVMLAREMPELHSVLSSDVAPLNNLIRSVLDQTGDAVTFMRDPTRGGLSGLCADLTRQCGYRILMDEAAIPVRPEARHAADMLGLDPLEIANEGKVVLAVDPARADTVLAALHNHPLGRNAVLFATVTDDPTPTCEIQTTIGGRRIIQKPYGEQLPRIC